MKYSKEQIYNTMSMAIEELGTEFSYREYKAWSMGKPLPSANTIINIYGSWKNALTEFNIDIKENYSDSYIIKCLHDAHQIYKDQLSVARYSEWAKKYNKPHYTTIIKRFMNWDNALIIAKISLNNKKFENKKIRRLPHYKNDEIINSIKKFYNEGKNTSSRMYRKLNYRPSVDVAITRFGSWNNALKAAGIPINIKKE